MLNFLRKLRRKSPLQGSLPAVGKGDKGAYKAFTSTASAGIVQNKKLMLNVRYIYENLDLSTTSVYQTIKDRQHYLGWKYATEKSYEDINQFFFENPDRREVIADFNFYYEHFVLFYNHQSNIRATLLRVSQEIEQELEQRQ